MSSKGEVEVQNFVSDHYENTRFTLPYAKKYQLWFFEQLISLLNPKGLILDNGCGTGHLAEVLPKERIIGVDISENMASKARERLSEVYVASAEKLPFRENYFDSIFCRSLLHHLPNPRAAVSECYRVLKPGGRIIFSDTHRNFITAWPREIMRKHSSHFSEEHKNFTKREMIEYIKPFFEIKKVEYLGFLAYTVFGFPDVINFQKYLPFKSIVYKSLVASEKLLGKLPLIKKLAANIVVVAQKIK